MSSEPRREHTDGQGKPGYILPHDEKEFSRLDLQHEAVKLAFEGLNICNEEVDQVLDPSGGEKRVLDIGSGSGVWCIEMSKRYPNADILGVDIKPQDQSEIPEKCLFEVWDVNDGLEKFYGQFDLVHTRFTTGIYLDPEASFIEMQRCLKPGGLLIIVSASFLVSKDRKTFYPFYTKMNPEGSWFQRSMMQVLPALKKLNFDSQRFEREITKGLWKYELLDPSTCAAAWITPPAGPWAQSPDPDESARLKKVGEYWRDNLLVVQRHWEQLHQLIGGSREEWELTVKNVEEEILEARHQVSMRMRAIWGRARGPTNPPLMPPWSKSFENSGEVLKIISIHQSEDEWARLSAESQATITPEMQSCIDGEKIDPII